MPFYTLEDYAKDLEALPLPQLLGSLNATYSTINCLKSLRKTQGISRSDRITIAACKEHVPILLRELERRGASVPQWIDSIEAIFLGKKE